jgi:aromatic-L-amino-acid decarboxylase
MVPEYLRTPDAEDAWSLSEYGPALGRRFRALKLWAVLRCYGRRGLAEHIRRGVAQAELFEGLVREDPAWEVAAERHFSLVCFRAAGGDETNRRILERVNASGEAFLSHCVLDGRYTLRLAVGSPLTTDDDIHRTWELLRRAALGGDSLSPRAS